MLRLFSSLIQLVKNIIYGHPLDPEIEKKIQATLAKYENFVNELERQNFFVHSGKIYHFQTEIEEYLSLLEEYRNNKKHHQKAHKFIDLSKDLINRLPRKIEILNQKIMDSRIRYCRELFKDEPFELSNEQIEAIVADDKYNLIVAGAGSGKTEVLVKKVKYLVEGPLNIDPDRICVFAFQKKAQIEVSERLEKRYELKGVKVNTFHSFGYSLLNRTCWDSDEKVPDVFYLLSKFEWFQKKVINYLLNQQNKDLKDREEFENETEFISYMKSRQYTYKTIDGQKVKSEAERIIYNLLSIYKINGKDIDFKYEDEAFWMGYKLKNNTVRNPQPDFFIKEFDLYLEHWGIDLNGKVPKWFNVSSGEYKKTMKIKIKKFNKQNKYNLAETFYYEYERNDGKDFEAIVKQKVTDGMKRKFPQMEIKWQRKSIKEIQSLIKHKRAMEVYLTDPLKEFIQSAKTQRLSPRDIEMRLSNGNWTKNTQRFGQIALAVYKKYEESKTEANAIDYPDMINQAVDKLKDKNKLYSDELDYILIDEYQDMSDQRLQLINTLLEKNPNCKLFCVGDDWQSIFGFSGSNLKYFSRFERYFPHFSQVTLSNNYRSNKPIVDLGSEIIKINGESQVAKETKAMQCDECKIELHEIDEKEHEDYLNNMSSHCLEKIDNYISQGIKPSEILILQRYKKDYKCEDALRKAARDRNIRIDDKNSSGKFVSKLTMHTSKGLESKVVFILGLDESFYGFPTQMKDKEILAPVKISAADDILETNNEEERRLFYVAVTRAKQYLHIYTQKNKRSVFLKEIDHILN